MRFDGNATEREPEASADARCHAVTMLELHERLEDANAFFGRNAGTAIGDAELDRPAHTLCAQRDLRIVPLVGRAVANGCVTLQGEVDYITQKEDAARAVRNLTGVSVIINDIEVKPQAGALDVELAIQAALERRAKREAASVDVEAKDGHVTLTGIVHSRAEHDAIVGAAKGTRGVRSVEDKLYFVHPTSALERATVRPSSLVPPRPLLCPASARMRRATQRGTRQSEAVS